MSKLNRTKQEASKALKKSSTPPTEAVSKLSIEPENVLNVQPDDASSGVSESKISALGGPKKKKAAPMKKVAAIPAKFEDMMERSNKVVKETAKSMAEIEHEEKTEEAKPPVSKLKVFANKPTKKKAATSTFGPKHLFLEKRHTFPLHNLKEELASVRPGDENILDFTGSAQVTDAVLACMKDLPFNIRDSVIGVRLVGCHLVTDVGVEFLADCFHNVKKLILSGCPRVTEASLVVVAEKCTFLETLEIVGTNVAVLPRKLTDLILVTDCTPLVSPMPSEMKTLPDPTVDMCKLCVIRREGQSTLSVLRLLQGDKEVTASLPLQFKPNVPCGKDTMFNVIECTESTAGLFCHGWGVYVIPSELTDKNQINDEAKHIFSTILSIIAKMGGGCFVILGMHTSKAGIVPMDIVRESVQSLASSLLGRLEMKKSSVIDPANLGVQMELDQMERLKHRLRDLKSSTSTLTSLEVNVDEGDKAVTKLKDHLAAQSAKNPEHKMYCKTLGEFMKSFPDQGGKDLKCGIHTLSGAADLILQGPTFYNVMEAQGAVQYLAKTGKLSMYQQTSGREVYTSTPFLCQVLSTLLDGFPRTTNETKDIAINDKTFVMTEDELAERAGKAKVTAELLDQLVKECGVAGTTSVMGKMFIPYNCLLPQPEVSLDQFDKTPSTIQATYIFGLPVPVPPHVWYLALTRLTGFRWPTHLWRHGLILQHGIVELLITCEGEKITLLGQTVFVDTHLDTSEKCITLLWQCIEQYKLLLDHVFVSTGFVPQVVCNADKPRPDGINGVVDGHSVQTNTSTCHTCGEGIDTINILRTAEADVRPKMLSEGSVTFVHPQSTLKGGTLVGSVVTLVAGGKAVISAYSAEGGDRQQCTLLFDSSGFDSLSLSLSSFNKEVTMMFGGNDSITLASLATKKGPSQISKLVAGVALNVSIQTISDTKMECTVDCRGEVMAREVVPADQYRLSLDFKDKHQDGYSQAPPQGSDTVQFTVLSKHLGFMAAAVLRRGMRLEALDRQNPSLICVATIANIKPERKGKGGPILIHFDGWTERYDYWAEEDSPDLHPIGYMAEVGHPSGNPHLQAPHGYRKTFHWNTYLKEIQAEPVPFSFFTTEQTRGTKPDKTLSACRELGLSFTSVEGSKSLCFTLPYRDSALEHWVKQLHASANAEEPLKQSTFLKNNSRIFCLLPSNLDLKFLRYPSLATLFQPDKQVLHMLCAGQENLFHLVDHEGLKIGNIMKNYIGQEVYLQCVYLMLLSTGALTIPLNMKHLCKGVADFLPVDQQPRMERGFRRLYRLYLMLFHFLEIVTTTSKLEKRTSALDGQVQMQLKAALENSCQQTQFSQCFSHSPDFTKFQCKPHEAAISGDKGLTAFPTEVMELAQTGTLLNLYLFRNKLESLPDDLSTRLSTLTQLMVGDNKLTSLPSLSGFKCLTHLYIQKNQIKSFELTNSLSETLATLVISENPLGGLPPSVNKLSALTALIADNVGTVKSLEPLCGLTKLDRLSLSGCVVASLPDNFHKCRFTSLNLAAIPLAKPNSSSGIKAVTMESLLKTYERYTAVNLLSNEEHAGLFVQVPGKSEEENIASVNARLLKCFPRLHGNSFPTQLLKMTTLVRLDLSHQGFVTVPDDIQNLTKLKELILNGCFNLESISAMVSALPLESLSLNDCPSLKTPPKEIVNRGFQAVFGYLRRLQLGSVDCKRTKLMMVGLGGAGKTSLVRSLRSGRFHQNYNYDEMITDGIDICEWDVPIRGEKQPLQFSVWDFAGQTVYYNTHQFFLSNRAVYMLLWNIRLGYEHAGLDFWLSSIACHAPKAPVLVVGTHSDKVNKSHIPEMELKRRFPQIQGFHFVSSYTGDGIAKLKEELNSVTLTQKYMGEKIPEVWLNLEKQLVSIRDEGKALLPWKEVQEAGDRSGIFDNDELTQAIQFLHDLGSVQFFNTEFLRSNVVIVPQWIVDVMACVVTVHDGPIKNGILRHEDLEEVWHAYPKELHTWLLRLTEEFDLTFSLPDQRANIIPCLLPETEPSYKWTPVKRDSGQRDMKMIYKFGYLPAGLFNRAQVRLQEFSDNAVLWKKGSLLKKNGHIALVLQTGNIEVLVKAQGYKPENMLFLVHEVFECLIAESYSGVHYDYYIPCMECQSTNQSEPCMFPRSKVQRAVEFKAPFLQCDSFHIMSIPEIQAIMPPDHSSDFDDHLRRGVNELYSLEEDLVISVFYCYSRKNVPGLDEVGKIVHPGTVLEELRGAGYKVSFTDDPENANMEALTLSIKAAQVVIIGISDEFLANKQCYSLIFYARETLKKPILLMTLGKTSDWQKQDINFLLGNEVYVKMQDISRYEPKIKELIAAVKTKAGVKVTETFPDCFISYCWKNSQAAVKLGTVSDPSALGWGDPRNVKDFLHTKGITCWLDIERMGQEGFYEDLARGVRTSKVMVAFVSDEYALSKTCRMEFQFAVSSVRIPVIVAVVGTGFQWESSEIGMLSVGHNCHKVNLQLENQSGLEEIVNRVKDVIGKTTPTASTTPATTTSSQRKIAFQEAMELTQRKLLRQLVMFMASSGHESFPHIVLIDLVDKDAQGQGQEENGKDKECDGCDGEGEAKNEEEKEGITGLDDLLPSEETASDQYCFRALCEWEQGWHSVPGTIPFSKEAENDTFFKEVAPFCMRLMAVLKHTSLSLPVLTLPQGEQLYKNFEEWSSQSNVEFEAAYKYLIDMVQKQDKLRTFGGLRRCHVTNGKQLWLCPEHSARMGNVSLDSGMASTSVPYTNPEKEEEEKDDDDDDGSDNFDESSMPPPEAPNVQHTPAHTPDPSKRPDRLQKRTSSRACRLM